MKLNQRKLVITSMNFLTNVAKTHVSKIDTAKIFNEYLEPKQVDFLFLTPISKKEIDLVLRLSVVKNPVISMRCQQNFYRQPYHTFYAIKASSRGSSQIT